MNNLKEKIKETVAMSASEVLTNKVFGGKSSCIVLLFSEPKMPDELVLENIE